MRTRALAPLLLACPPLLLAAPVPAADVGQAGVPDAKSDCNGNGVPDALDIASGVSADLDHDGVPDECCDLSCSGADCNGNLVEDLFDIVLGTSLDCNCNSVPDECEGEPPCDPPGRNGRRGGWVVEPPEGLPDEPGFENPVCAGGSPSLHADDLVLTFTGLPAGASATVVVANASKDPKAGVTPGGGRLDLSGPVELVAVKAAGGSATIASPLAKLAALFEPGDTLRFQCLFETKHGVGVTRAYLVTVAD